MADAIAQELGVTAQDAKSGAPGDEQLLFLGSGTYGGKLGEAMMKYIGAGTFAGRKVAVFGTSGGAVGAEKMIGAMSDALRQKGGTVAGS